MLGGAGLAADDGAGIAAFAPVPFSTTPLISSFSRAAVDGRIASRDGRDPAVATRLPPARWVRSTRYGGRTWPPPATAAATVAICSGVARVLYCPIEESPSCARSTEASKVDRETEKGMRRVSSLKPNASAVAAMSRTPTSTPSLANTVLQDRSNASRSDAFRQPSASLVSRVRVPAGCRGRGSGSARPGPAPRPRPGRRPRSPP